MKILKLAQLREWLHSDSQRMRMWATYQLIENHDDQAKVFVEDCLDSEDEEICEAGIFLIGKHKLRDHEFRLLGIFQHSKGRMKRASAIALCALDSESSRSLLWRWLKMLMEQEELNIPDLNCAAECWLSIENKKGWSQLNELLSENQNNHLKSLTLFESLCNNATESSHYEAIYGHYSSLRSQFTDPQFTQILLDSLENNVLLQYVLNQNIESPNYRNCFVWASQQLGFELDPDAERILEKIDALDSLEFSKSLPLFPELMKILPGKEQLSESLEYVSLQIFSEKILSEWDSTTLKIQDLEKLLLKVLPLNWLVIQQEHRILTHPSEEVELLHKLFSTQLLRDAFRDQIIEQLIEETRKSGTVAEIPKLPPGFPYGPKFVLWNLLSVLPSPEAFSYPTWLPKPWQHQLPRLNEALTRLYRDSFQKLVENSSHDHLEYALELFIRFPDSEVMELMLEHFNRLINEHYLLFFDFIEKHPDRRFIDKLFKHYREGETALAQLLSLLCTIHDHPIEHEDALTETEMISGNHPQVRVFCVQCRTSYHYHLDVLYFDEEKIEQRSPFEDEDLWTPQQLECKNCGKGLEFKTDLTYRSSLYSEMLTKQLLRLSEDEQKRLERVKPLKFPKFLQMKMNPGRFLEKMGMEMEHGQLSEAEKGLLFLEMGKFRLQLDEMKTAKEVLNQGLELSGSPVEIRFFLGLIAYQEKNLAEARTHFNSFVRSSRSEDFEMEDENLHQVASHYLELMERKEFKRSSFKLLN